MTNTIIRSPMKSHGGKAYLAPWIIGFFPARDDYTHYCEPFAGGLAVLFRHDPEGKSETVNDINGEITNFWNVLREEASFEEFKKLCEATPLSEVDWREAVATYGCGNAVQRAWAFFIRFRLSRQSIGKDYVTPTRRTRRGMNEQVSAWTSAVDGLSIAHERLRRVEVRNMDAVALIGKYDHAQTVFYCDPPYLASTRVAKNVYQCEMSESDHLRLLECLARIKGKFLLSGYQNELYHSLLVEQCGFRCEKKVIDNKASSQSKKPKKTECLWTNF